MKISRIFMIVLTTVLLLGILPPDTEAAAEPLSLEGARVLVGGNYYYNGQPQIPQSVQVVLPNGWVVPEDQYTVTAQENIFATTEDRKARVQVTALEDKAYRGTAQGTFEILPRSLTVQALDQRIPYGQEIAMGPDQVTAWPAEGDVVMGVRLTATPENTIVPRDVLIQRGDQDVTHCYEITYGPGALTVEPAQPILYFQDYDPSRTYDGTALPLPTPEQITGADYENLTFTWYRHTLANANRMGQAPVDAGTYFLRAEAAPTEHTLPAHVISEAIRIAPQPIDVSRLTWTSTRLPFRDREQTVTLADLPETVTAGEYLGNTGYYAGRYSASVELFTDKNHCLPTPVLTTSWTIVPGRQTVTVLHGLDNPYEMRAGETLDLSRLVQCGVPESVQFTLREGADAILEGSLLTAREPGTLSVEVRVPAWDCNGDGEPDYAETTARNLWLTVKPPEPTPETTTPEPSREFSDVSRESWYHDAVDYVLDHGLMSGLSEDSFGPGESATRAMLVTALYRMEGSPPVSGEIPFTDVPAGTWYTDAVCWAAEHGIAAGMTPDRFVPGDFVTRAQLSAIVYRYARLRGYGIAARTDLSEFEDSGDIPWWAVEPMQWAVAETLLSGVSETLLSPGSDATRAQTAAVLRTFREEVTK